MLHNMRTEPAAMFSDDWTSEESTLSDAGARALKAQLTTGDYVLARAGRFDGMRDEEIVAAVAIDD